LNTPDHISESLKAFLGLKINFHDADPNPGSEFFYPGSRFASGMNIPVHISESLETFFGLTIKLLKADF
jgi:hypothetical protein